MGSSIPSSFTQSTQGCSINVFFLYFLCISFETGGWGMGTVSLRGHKGVFRILSHVLLLAALL